MLPANGMKMECLEVMIKGALKSIKPFYAVTEVIGLAGKDGVLSKHLQDLAHVTELALTRMVT